MVNLDYSAHSRFLAVCDLASQDVAYQDLVRRCAALDLPLLAVMEKLSEEERQIVKAYIQLVGNSALRLLELACEDPSVILNVRG